MAKTRVYSKYIGTSLDVRELSELHPDPTITLLCGVIVDESASHYEVEVLYQNQEPHWLRGVTMFITLTFPKERIHNLIG